MAPSPAQRGRPRDEVRRRELTVHAADVLVASESCEISLRRLADALGESPRMLIHHFGSRDGLIAAALSLARTRLLARARGQIADRAPSDLRGLVATLYAVITDPLNRPAFRLFDEVNALSQTQPERFPDFGRASVYDWLGQMAALLSIAFEEPEDPDGVARATLALGVIRGLMLDLNATGERVRIEAALRLFERP